MNIFLISNMYPSQQSPYYGIFVKTFAENIQDDEVKITRSALIKGSGKGFISKISKYIKFFFNVYKGLLYSDYDIIYVHYAEHSLLPLLPFYIFLKKKLVINAHGDDIKLDSLISRLVEPIIRKANALVVPSNYFKNLAISKNLNDNIIVSASGGINTEKFKPFTKKEKEESFIVGCISRIDKDKGWDTLIEASEQIVDRIPNIEVHIIGHGGEEKLLKKQLENDKIKDKVHFLGSKPNEELPNYYNQFDVFVFPSLRESLGVVGLEALSCGIPVIGSRIGPIEEYVVNDYNGFLFNPGDSDDLAKTIIKYYDLGAEKQLMFEQNAFKTSQKYDSIEVAKRLKKQITKTL